MPQMFRVALFFWQTGNRIDISFYNIQQAAQALQNENYKSAAAATTTSNNNQ